MILLVMSAMTIGAFAFTITLWATGYGQGSIAATARLDRLKSREQGQSGTAAAIFNLRKRAGVRFGGINLVSVSAAATQRVQLERAGLALNVREFFMMRAAVGLGVATLVFVFLPLPQFAFIAAIGGFVLGFFAVGVWLKQRIGARTRKLENQLIELLQMLSSGLRAGFGLIQALDGCAAQVPAPLSIEIRRTLRDISMGSSIEQAFSGLNDRVGSSDFDIVITAIMIQRSVGGNLAEILENVAHTMRERERIRGEIRTLTSQQRLTGYVIGGIPVGLFIAFMVINPEFTSLLITDPFGRILLAGAIMLEIMGFLVIRKIVNIEV